MGAIVGEIRMFAGDFAPEGWAVCNGAILEITEYRELFSLIETTYGGDGRKTFNLPDMVGDLPDTKKSPPKKTGRIPIHIGTGPGLSVNTYGESGGEDLVTPTVDHLPPHTHSFRATTKPADRESPKDGVLAKAPAGQLYYSPPTGAGATQVKLAEEAMTPAGAGTPVALGMPSLGVVYIICLRGEYPELTA